MTRLLVHTTEIPMRWCDMDAFGHANNSVFFSYFEIARIEWWYQAMPAQTNLLDIGPVLVNAQCTFHKAIVYPDTLIVKLYVGPAGRSSYDCFYEIFSKNETGKLYADGSTKVVWVDRKANKSISLPDDIRQLLPANE